MVGTHGSKDSATLPQTPILPGHTTTLLFFHSSPRSCRHNREPSRSSCCKADLSMPWISPRETSDTRPLLISTSRSVKHRGRCRSWTWSSSNFRQKSSRQNPWSPLLYSQQYSKVHCVAQGIFIKPFLRNEVFASRGYLGKERPRRGCAGIRRERELLRGSGISPSEAVPPRTAPPEAFGAAAAQSRAEPGHARVRPLPAGTARPPQLLGLGPRFPAGGPHQTRMSSGAQAGRSSSILPVIPLSVGAREALAPAARSHGPGPGPGPGPPYLGSGAAGCDRPRRSGRGAGRAAPCPTGAGRCGRCRGRGVPRTARAWREHPPGSPSRTATAQAPPARGSGAH